MVMNEQFKRHIRANEGEPGLNELIELHDRFNQLVTEGKIKELPLDEQVSLREKPRGHRGNRKKIDIVLKNGETVSIPRELLSEETAILEYAERRHNEDPEHPYFYAKDLFNDAVIKAEVKNTGFVYKMMGKLIKWHCLISRFDPVDCEKKGPAIRATAFAITDSGLEIVSLFRTQTGEAKVKGAQFKFLKAINASGYSRK
ncbi:MAG: hypothetical protein HYW86_03185 [Candidatus Roizmanbacteria bacterium]|nr:MAG: hypothetical protein HYW86_03185 [Candidatus Roizmanbacteria bacterium]